MKILLAARCRSAYFLRMAKIPLAHFAICKLQENCKSPPFSETALIFIHLKRCTIEIFDRQRHFRFKNVYFPEWGCDSAGAFFLCLGKLLPRFGYRFPGGALLLRLWWFHAGILCVYVCSVLEIAVFQLNRWKSQYYSCCG